MCIYIMYIYNVCKCFCIDSCMKMKHKSTTKMLTLRSRPSPFNVTTMLSSKIFIWRCPCHDRFVPQNQFSNKYEPQAAINYTFDITCGASNAAWLPLYAYITITKPCRTQQEFVWYILPTRETRLWDISPSTSHCFSPSPSFTLFLPLPPSFLLPPPAGKEGCGLCHFPPVLHLHLMWFQYDPVTDIHVKIDNRYHPGIMAS